MSEVRQYESHLFNLKLGWKDLNKIWGKISELQNIWQLWYSRISLWVILPFWIYLGEKVSGSTQQQPSSGQHPYPVPKANLNHPSEIALSLPNLCLGFPNTGYVIKLKKKNIKCLVLIQMSVNTKCNFTLKKLPGYCYTLSLYKSWHKGNKRFIYRLPSMNQNLNNRGIILKKLFSCLQDA